jgi:predicted nucleic acid-binding protein
MTLLANGRLPVIDASIAIKWYLPEVYSTEARLLVEGKQFTKYSRMHVPDLFFPECGNILWKRQRRGEMSAEKVAAVIEALLALPFVVHSHSPLIQAAMAIATNTESSVYDSLYVALAIREQTQLVTADEKLYKALQRSPLAAHLLWAEDIKDIL